MTSHTMSQSVNRPLDISPVATKALKYSAQFWFTTAAIGQWLFAVYIALYYGGSAMHGNWEAWNKVFPRGYVAGEPFSNLVVAAHLLLAVITTIGGPLQLIPQVRARAPRFHRWLGRTYILSAFAISIAGLYMGLVRGSVGDTTQHVGIVGNAIAIMFCAAMALRYALARKFAIHRRWALRLFLAMGGVWFFRVGLMFWLTINKGPAGFDMQTFTGPFLNFLGFAVYVVPLVLLEAYLRAQDSGSPRAKVAVATTLVVSTLAMAVGIFVAVVGMWLPRL